MFCLAERDIVPGHGCSELGVMAVGPLNVTYPIVGSESFSCVGVWKRILHVGEVGVCLHLHLSECQAVGDARAGMERRRQPAAELPPSPGLQEDVSDCCLRSHAQLFWFVSLHKNSKRRDFLS